MERVERMECWPDDEHELRARDLLLPGLLLVVALVGIGSWIWGGDLSKAELRYQPSANVLFVVLDDVGFDLLENSCTPNIDAFAASGATLTNAYVSPGCSPTRARMLTGRRPYETGIGTIVKSNGTQAELSAGEYTLARAWPSPSAHIGKWHLAEPASDTYTHPMEVGFSFADGNFWNLGFGAGNGYVNWERSKNGGDPFLETQYHTTWTTDRTRETIARMPYPWFVVASYAASHTPFHCPPDELVDCAACPLGGSAEAMTEALDTEIGRLLNSLPPETYVFLFSDNGTSKKVYGSNKSKSTVYEGGINVPFYVAGPGIAAGSSTDALVEVNDLFATVSDLVGLAGPVPASSVSFAPALLGGQGQRSHAYSERFTQNGDPMEAPIWTRAVRDQQGYKLIQRWADGVYLGEEFYFLPADPTENKPLWPAGLEYDNLLAYLEAL